jgi:sugar phosphate isomerase/epimerase
LTWPLLNADWSYWPEGVGRAEIWDRCAELEFDGIELGVYSADEQLAPERIREYHELSQRSSIGVRAVLFSLPPARWPQGAFASRDHAPQAVLEAIEVGRRAADLGLELLGVWPGADVLRRSVSYQDAWPRLVESFAEIDEALRRMGVRTAVEYKPGELLAGPDAALRLCESVASDSVGVILDTGHSLWAADDLPVVVGMLGAKLFHVHLGDSPPGTEGDLPPGRRHNFVPFFSALTRPGDTGAIALDLYGSIAEGNVTGDEASREGRDYVRTCIDLAGAAA